MGGLASYLIKRAARKAAKPFKAAVADCEGAQRRLLREMMGRNRDTEYGREHGFAKVEDLESYRENVPVVDYEDIRERIDRVTLGAENVLTAENPILFAQTSGTTGKPKFIPVTPSCRKGGGTTVWLHFACEDHPRMFDDKMLTIVSPAVEGHTEGGLPFGSTSGMVVKEIPKIAQAAYAVPYDVFEIHDYEAKYYTLLRLGMARKISFIGTANPSSILKLAELADSEADRLIRDIHDGTLDPEEEVPAEIRSAIAGKLDADPRRAAELEAMRTKRGRLVPKDYWPTMALLGCWKGGTVGAYIEKLRPWYDPENRGLLPIRDMGYLASEARMSIPISDDGAGGVLSVHLNVFEFVAADEIDDQPDDPSAWNWRGASELEVGGLYYVFVTTTGGLYRYDINDVVEVVGYHQTTPVIIFRRKGRGMTNLTGEKLSVNQVIDAIERSEKRVGVKVLHFRVEPDGEGSRYVFKVEGEIPPDKRRELLETLDHELGELNIEYRAKRESTRLRDPRLQVMKPGWYERGKQAMVAEGKRLFQAKTVLLDAKRGYVPEPSELEEEVELG